MKKKAYYFIGIVIMIGILLFFVMKDPYTIDKSHSLQGPSWSHWLGSDYLGRDLFSRLIIGMGYSLSYSCLSLIGVIVISLVLGGLAGTLRGFVDTVITTFADILISIPAMLLALVFAGLFSNTVFTVLIAISLSWSGRYIRYVRNLVLTIRKEEYIVLAPMRGSEGMHTLVHHVTPALIPELTSLFLTDIGRVMLNVSGLAFLGIGVHPPVPELGTILYDGKMYFYSAPWLFIFPGILLSLIILASQYLGSRVKVRKVE